MRTASSKFLAFTTCVVAIVTLLAVSYAVRQRAKNLDCVKNLKLLYVAFDQYKRAEENKEFFPTLDRTHGDVMFDVDAMCPQYLSDSGPLISPFHADAKTMRDNVKVDPKSAFGDHSYWYLGYAICHERSALAWVDAVRDYLENGTPIEPVNEIWPDRKAVLDAKNAEFEPENKRRREVWEREAAAGIPLEKRSVPSTKGPGPALLYVGPDLSDLMICQPLREGVERFFITDIGNPAGAAETQTRIPVMMERPELHGDGGHVLYMDGHVEFVPYPGRFPMTQKFIEGLRSLDELEK